MKRTNKRNQINKLATNAKRGKNEKRNIERCAQKDEASASLFHVYLFCAPVANVHHCNTSTYFRATPVHLCEQLF